MRRRRAACIPDRRGKPARRRRGPAQDDEAEQLYDIALKGDLRHQPFDHARLQLAYGAWLRRQRRVSESRPPLRAARQVFDALACGPWGERARQELRAAGEQSPDRVPAARDRLTAQELQTAQRTASPGQGKVRAVVTGTMGLTCTDEGGFQQMVTWDDVTRTEVLRAIREYDRLGPDQFFAAHGFGPTTTYDLLWEEHRYPPKAILGTAYEFATGQRLAPGDFEGGKSGAVRVLGGLGFTVAAKHTT